MNKESLPPAKRQSTYILCMRGRSAICKFLRSNDLFKTFVHTETPNALSDKTAEIKQSIRKVGLELV